MCEYHGRTNFAKSQACFREYSVTFLTTVHWQKRMNERNIVGFCFSHFDDFTIWLDWFSVEPSERKKGVGTAIIQALLETATERHAHKIWCDTRSSNEPSKTFFRKLGFKEIAEVKDHWYRQDFILWERFV
jgi:RimJ/RimL family protein N-acetyltransferase